MLAEGVAAAGVSGESISRKLVFRIQNNNHQNTWPEKKKIFEKCWLRNETYVPRVASVPVLTR